MRAPTVRSWGEEATYRAVERFCEPAGPLQAYVSHTSVDLCGPPLKGLIQDGLSVHKTSTHGMPEPFYPVPRY
jgi:hypothetical protein